MSKEKTWKVFDQLLVSPSVRYGRSSHRSNGPRRPRKPHSSKRDSILHTREQDDGWQIDDHSDDDTMDNRINASDTLPPTITPSVPQSLNPAEITIERSNQSDSEIEHISEDECHPQNDDTSSDASDSDDCLAIHCTKSRMTRLQFVDKNPMKRRRITDDMDVSFAVGTSRAKNRPLEDAVVSPKRFKSVSTLNRTIQTSAGSVGLNNSVIDRSTRCWKSFDASFTEQEATCIDEQPSSPETDNINEGQCLLNIEELPSSAEESSSRNQTCLKNSATSTPKCFYVTSPEAKKRNKYHHKGSPFATLEEVLNERSSRQLHWQHAITSGTVQPDLVVKLDSIERIFGRVMLRFFTTTHEADDCVREQFENVIFLDQGDKQLKSIHAGMEIALEVDERIAPHRVSHNKLVHLGVTKLCPVPYGAK